MYTNCLRLVQLYYLSALEKQEESDKVPLELYHFLLTQVRQPYGRSNEYFWRVWLQDSIHVITAGWTTFEITSRKPSWRNSIPIGCFQELASSRAIPGSSARAVMSPIHSSRFSSARTARHAVSRRRRRTGQQCRAARVSSPWCDIALFASIRVLAGGETQILKDAKGIRRRRKCAS